MRDYYEILGVSRQATEADIKKAYRRLAREHHPDINSHDEEAESNFREVAEAYEVLGDAQKRQMYDTYGHTGRAGAAGGPGQGFGGFGGAAGFEDIFDVLFEGFGGSRQRRRSPGEPGANLRTTVSMTFSEAAFGVEKKVEVLRPVVCEDCKGSGSTEGKKPSVCKICGGQGAVNQTQSTIFGSFSRAAACSNCEGTGQVITSPCKACKGEGRMGKKEKISVKVPPGVETGLRLQLSGYGGAGRRGGPTGDLFVDINVEPHKVFQRAGNDIILTQPISFSHAALGGELTVPTLEGEEEIVIPQGTQAGTKFRLKGKGIPYLDRRGRGDQIVETKVETPKSLSDDQKQLFLELAEMGGESHNGDAGIFKKIKEAFGK